MIFLFWFGFDKSPKLANWIDRLYYEYERDQLDLIDVFIKGIKY